MIMGIAPLPLNSGSASPTLLERTWLAPQPKVLVARLTVGHQEKTPDPEVWT